MEKALNIAMVAGGVMLLAGAVLKITGPEVAVWLYLAGAVLFATAQFYDRYGGRDPVMRRLRGQQVLGAVLLLFSALLMYAERWRPGIVMNTGMADNLRAVLSTLTSRNNWIVFAFVAAVFELYSSFRMDAEEHKDRKAGD